MYVCLLSSVSVFVCFCEFESVSHLCFCQRRLHPCLFERFVSLSIDLSFLLLLLFDRVFCHRRCFCLLTIFSFSNHLSRSLLLNLFMFIFYPSLCSLHYVSPSSHFTPLSLPFHSSFTPLSLLFHAPFTPPFALHSLPFHSP